MTPQNMMHSSGPEQPTVLLSRLLLRASQGGLQNAVSRSQTLAGKVYFPSKLTCRETKRSVVIMFDRDEQARDYPFVITLVSCSVDVTCMGSPAPGFHFPGRTGTQVLVLPGEWKSGVPISWGSQFYDTSPHPKPLQDLNLVAAK